MLRIDEATAVLVGNTFNVAIFQQAWLLETEIFSRDDFSGQKNIFTPVAVSVSSEGWSFLVVPERIQLVFSGERAPDDFPGGIDRIVGGISRELPHTPVNALGFNFSFSVSCSDPARYQEVLKKLFVCPGNPLGDYFNSEDARYGAYFSKNIERFGAGMRLDIKPDSNEGKEFLRLNFNVHKDIARMADVSPALAEWPDLYEEIRDIAESVSTVFD